MFKPFLDVKMAKKVIWQHSHYERETVFRNSWLCLPKPLFREYNSNVRGIYVRPAPGHSHFDPDIVRGGRCSLFVPICDPEDEDAEDFFNWMIRSFKEEGIELDEETSNLLREKSIKENYEFLAGDYRRFVNDLISEKEYYEKILKVEFSVRQFIAE